jgi:hypothetical protein
VYTSGPNPRREQADGARGDECPNARSAAEQIRDAHEPPEHRHRQPGVVSLPDDPEVSIAYQRNEHEPYRTSTDDDHEKQGQIQRHLRFVDRDQNARPGRSKRDEGE